MEDSVNRRSFLMATGTAGTLAALSSAAQAAAGTAAEVVAEPGFDATPFAKQSVKFAVIGLDHYHIFGMTAAVQCGGGKLVSVYATDPKQLADFRAKFDARNPPRCRCRPPLKGSGRIDQSSTRSRQ